MAAGQCSAGSREPGPRCRLYCLRGPAGGPDGPVNGGRWCLGVRCCPGPPGGPQRPPPAEGCPPGAGCASAPPALCAARAGPGRRDPPGAERPRPPGGAAGARPAEGAVTMWPLPSPHKMAQAAPAWRAHRRPQGANTRHWGPPGYRIPSRCRDRKAREILKSVSPPRETGHEVDRRPPAAPAAA